MVSVIELTNAMVATLQKIPELEPLLENGIVGYIDENPTKNSIQNAIYQMPAGSLLVVWQGTNLQAAQTMEAWLHVLQIYVRAQRGRSALEIIDALVDGVPVPGDGLRWRFCPLIPGVLPTAIHEIVRIADEEGIDYFVVTTATQETGDE